MQKKIVCLSFLCFQRGSYHLVNPTPVVHCLLCGGERVSYIYIYIYISIYVYSYINVYEPCQNNSNLCLLLRL